MSWLEDTRVKVCGGKSGGRNKRRTLGPDAGCNNQRTRPTTLKTPSASIPVFGVPRKDQGLRDAIERAEWARGIENF